jgi:hypothetical protein
MAGLADAIATAQDPAAKAARLFNRELKRGAPIRNEKRDFEIAISVQRHIESGKSDTQAYKEVAQVNGIAWRTIKAIYRRFPSSELKAEIALSSKLV